jgi:hypothetical protein
LTSKAKAKEAKFLERLETTVGEILISDEFSDLAVQIEKDFRSKLPTFVVRVKEPKDGVTGIVRRTNYPA